MTRTLLFDADRVFERSELSPPEAALVRRALGELEVPCELSELPAAELLVAKRLARFGAPPAPVPTAEGHASAYDAAELYEVAFSYRDYAREYDFLAARFAARRGRPPASFLELCAGPAGHALAAARRGARSTALDLSGAMVALARRRATELGLPLEATQQDVRTFVVNQPVELAACLLDSVTYLLTNDDFLAHLKAVAAAVVPGALYVIECSHPGDLFGVRRSTKTEWTTPSPAGPVSASWNRVPGHFNPISQVALVKATLRRGAEAPIEDVAWQRAYMMGELDALVRADGHFALIETFGDFSPVAADAPEAWRLLVVLERRGTP